MLGFLVQKKGALMVSIGGHVNFKAFAPSPKVRDMGSVDFPSVQSPRIWQILGWYTREIRNPAWHRSETLGIRIPIPKTYCEAHRLLGDPPCLLNGPN